MSSSDEHLRPIIDSKSTCLKMTTQNLRSQFTFLAYALLLFLCSLLMVAVLAKFSVLEFSGKALACKWDCIWYRTIMTSGYQASSQPIIPDKAANWAFFPLFPLLAKCLSILFGLTPERSLLFTSKLLLLPTIYFFMLYAQRLFGAGFGIRAGLLLTFNPAIIYAHTGYTETLYSLLTTLAFFCLERRQWILAGVLGGFLSAVRVVGIIFILPFLMRWKSAQMDTINIKKKYLLGLLLCPVGLVAFMWILYVRTGDPFAFMHIQAAWGRTMSNPVLVLTAGLRSGGWGAIYALTALFAVFVSIWLWFRKFSAHSVFLAAAILIPLATSLASMPRYLFWQMPLFVGVLDLIGRRASLFGIYLAMSSAMAAFMILSWLSGMKSYVT